MEVSNMTDQYQGLKKVKRVQRRKILERRYLSHGVMIFFCIIFAFPFIWMFSTSLKSQHEIFSKPLGLFSGTLHWENYSAAVTQMDFIKYFGNTIYVTFMSIIGQLFGSTLVAYSLSIIDWKGKKVIFGLVLATMMIPIQVTMIPVYIIFRNLGLIGGFWPLILPAFTGAPIYIFLLRQFFMKLPISLIEAAKIDGSSEIRTFLQIAVPLCKPVLLAVAVVTFLNTWSDFLGPLIYLTKESNFTLTLGMRTFIAQYSVEWHKLMAASTLFTTPVVLLYFFAQKHFIQGITLTGIKG